MSEITRPVWNNASEYLSLSDPKLRADLDEGSRLLEEITQLSKSISLEAPDDRSLEAITRIDEIEEKAVTLIWDVMTFARCEVSLNGNNVEARKWVSLAQEVFAKYKQAVQESDLFLARASEATIEKILADPQNRHQVFRIRHLRKRRSQLLSLEEETLISALGVHGHTAWDNLHSTLSSSLKCDVDLPGKERKTLGLAAATQLLESSDGEVRSAAFHAISRAWENEKETCASILNAITGWRLELCKRRSRVVPEHYLDQPAHSNRISRKTLDAIFSAVASRKEVGRKANRLCARALGKERLDPWDAFAPPPARSGATTSDEYSFANALNLICEAAAQISPEMADFFQLMARNGWIDALPSEKRSAGGYCTKFLKSRTPRIFMTYEESLWSLRVLAHELGHAFHNWVMRDCRLAELDYPLSLAETASIFNETMVSDTILQSALRSADAARSESIIQPLWSDARNISLQLLNIPARFEFEKEICERRASGELSADELCELNEKAWHHWYGDSLSQMDRMFWAGKKHFFMTGKSFYNFPYVFGYLFSLGVYAQREKLGQEFYPAYVGLLRDTGRMTAEDLAMKHLGADLTSEDFWLESIAIAELKLAQFEAALAP